MLFCFITISIVLVNCAKEPGVPPSQELTKEKNELTTPNVGENFSPDNQCSNENLALRNISFGSVPSTVTHNFTLATASNVAIFARDCCIRDDVVEIWVDGCLVATVDSRPGEFGTHPGETHTVTLPAGNHTINYVNTVSLPGGSGWAVSETESAASTIVIDGCNTGVPNYDVTCGNSMSELIMACAAGAANHGAFVSCVAHLTNAWKKAGLITGAQKDAIMDCAGSSNLP